MTVNAVTAERTPYVVCVEVGVKLAQIRESRRSARVAERDLETLLEELRPALQDYCQAIDVSRIQFVHHQAFGNYLVTIDLDDRSQITANIDDFTPIASLEWPDSDLPVGRTFQSVNPHIDLFPAVEGDSRGPCAR